MRPAMPKGTKRAEKVGRDEAMSATGTATIIGGVNEVRR